MCQIVLSSLWNPGQRAVKCQKSVVGQVCGNPESRIAIRASGEAPQREEAPHSSGGRGCRGSQYCLTPFVYLPLPFLFPRHRPLYKWASSFYDRLWSCHQNSAGTINWRLGKPSMVEPCAGILLSQEKELVSVHATTWVNLRGIVPHERNWTEKAAC